VVFNDALAARKAAYKAGEPYIPDAALSKRLTVSKGTPERAWLAEVSSVVLQQALADLNEAYRNFLDSVSGKRKGPRVAPPRFRSRKDSRQSIRFMSNAFRCWATVGCDCRRSAISRSAGPVASPPSRRP
jgi:putative transposase